MRRLGTVVAVFLFAHPLGAQGQAAPEQPTDATERARALHQQGVRAMADGNRELAVRSFREALSVERRASLALNLALILQEDGKLREAVQLYKGLIAGSFGPVPITDEELRHYLQTAERDQPQALISATGAAHITVSIDGETVGQVGPEAVIAVPLDPGAHVARAQAGERSSPEFSFTVARGERRPVSLVVPVPVIATAQSRPTNVITTDPPRTADERRTEPHDGSSTVWWVLGGAGVATLVTAAILIAVTANTTDPFEEGPVPRLEALR